MKKTSILEMNRLSVDEFHKAEKMPLVVVLDDVRSLYNVGSVFRSSDAFRVEAIYLCGITAVPDDVKDSAGNVIKECTLKCSQEIHKTALGAEDSVSWRYFKDAKDAVNELHNNGYTVLAVEQCHGSTLLGDFRPWNSLLKPSAPLNPSDPLKPSETLETASQEAHYAVILGNEVKGVHQDVIDMCDGCLEIPQYGTKHSLNVSVTAGIIIWHFASNSMA